MILNMSLVLNGIEFCISQGSECASGFEYARILNIPEFWICQGYTEFRICLNDSWICLNMPEYTWICLNLPKWLLFNISPLHSFCTWKHGSLFERLQETRGCFLKETKFNFFYGSWKYSVYFSLLSSEKGVGGRESWYILLMLCFFLVKTCEEIR